MVLDHLLPSIQIQSFLEWTRTAFEQSLAEFTSFSWRISSSCFRDVAGGNLFLTLVSKTDHSGSIMFKSGDCAGQGRCWSSPSCSSNHDWTVPAVPFSSWKAASLFGNNVWIMGCIWLPNLSTSTYSLAVIRSWRVIMGAKEYCTTILLPKPSQIPPPPPSLSGV
jgi:hypothetical protein